MATERAAKTPQLRNIYTKIAAPLSVGRGIGPKIRGNGLNHQGAIDNLLRFLNAPVFIFPGSTPQQRNAQQRDLAHFVEAFSTNLHPAVGQQVTFARRNFAAAGPAVDLLARIAVQSFEPTGSACDLIAKGIVNGTPRGWVLSGNQRVFQSDTGALASLQQLKTIALATGEPMTFTCAPAGDGTRLGIDRDEDGILDGQ